jgi:hypothetical protein
VRRAFKKASFVFESLAVLDLTLREETFEKARPGSVDDLREVIELNDVRSDRPDHGTPPYRSPPISSSTMSTSCDMSSIS